MIPVFNEEAGIDELLRRVEPVCRENFGNDYEIILINDGSTDASWDLMCKHADANPHIVAINLSRNHGHQLALGAGLEAACGDFVFVLDADLQDPPELLGTMLSKARQGFDVVYGQRSVRHGETAFKRGTASLFYRLLARMVDTEIPHDTGDFRLMTRRVKDHLIAMPERYRFVRGMISWIGFKQTGVLYERDTRFAGTTHYPLRQMVALAVDAITSFSTVPLRFASHLGIGFGIAGMITHGWVGFSWVVGGTIAGWTSLAALILILGSVQLLVLGVFGEYIGRMYMESKRRPLFVVQEVRRSPAELFRANPTNELPTPAEEAIRATG